MTAEPTDPSAIAAAPPLVTRLAAETLGSGVLGGTVIASGIMATLISSDVGVQLLINAVSTGAALTVLILVLGPVSGAQLNPAVTAALAADGRVPLREILPTIAAQLVGFVLGAIVANLMFSGAAVSFSTTVRGEPGLLLGEVVATAGLVAVILTLVARDQRGWIPAAVGLYITSAYFATSSTSFANPGITIGRMLSESFAGIAPESAPLFVAAQLIGAAIGLLLVRLVMEPRARR
ncbi:aquaporin [Microcella sp.]|uniref:aquaporin n=1 Tax=Microcella sp. TaxID=1913979 RepID=UPI0025CCF4DA|nr:MIP/aquaporin family protein [Microcella sp.]